MKTRQVLSAGIAALLLIYSGIADAGSIQWSSPASQVSTQQHRAVTPAVKRNQPRVRVSTPFGHSTNRQNSRNQPVVLNQKPAEPKKKGRFRVTISGFHVVETYGGDSNKDGKGNEVYIGVKLRGYNRIGGLMFNGYKATKTIGDNKRYRNRLRGGSASNTGGFRRRDEYPVRMPFSAMNLAG
jgi:hypothetical protein